MKPILLALFLTLLFSIDTPSAQAATSSCRFFPEAGGYHVCDDEQARFLTALNGWGLQEIGYPISRRYERDGFITQAFQKAIMQWRADSGTVLLVNIFDELSRLGYDQHLLENHQTPRQLPAGWDGAGASFQQVVQKRQALLSTRPALRAAYLAAGDPLTFFGLPTSPVTDMGNHYAIRLQRAVLQEWKEDVPWAKRGQVTIANGGQIARELGALPAVALAPEATSTTPIIAPPPPPAAQSIAPPGSSASGPVPDAGNFDAAVREIDTFWQAQLATRSYQAPKVIAYSQQGVQTPCGFLERGTAAYCAGARTIYYDATFLEGLRQESGEFAPVAVLAHEWGHHIQYELQLTQPSAMERELQADCLAGAFAAHSPQGAMLADEEAQVTTLLFLVGDPETMPEDNPFAHGSGSQRQAAFTRGMQAGLTGCAGE